MKAVSMKYLLFLLLLLNSMLLAVTSPHGDIKIPCETCHTPANWQVDRETLKFDHNSTGYPLTGVHSQTDCKDCHESLVFHQTGVQCMDCHTDIHLGQLGKECESCHTPLNWENRQDLLKDHSLLRFPLYGAHERIDCDDCHHTGLTEYANTPVECIYCHADDYNATQNPDHKEAQFPTTCDDCHPIQSLSWQTREFDHSFYPLTGAHQNVSCMDCHQGTYNNTPNTCYGCHDTDFAATSDPNHQAFGFDTDCSQCHTTDTWPRTDFDHYQTSGFELIGVHQTLQCSQCHINNKVTGLQRDCYGCHLTDYNSVKEPDHQLGQYPHECTMCHNENTWSPATFDHNQTGFPLTGSHQAVECTDCHENNVYAGTPSDCYSCHEPDFKSATEPNHVTGNFDHTCTICHSTTAWSPATFDHNQTGFPLTGAHQAVECSDCHENNVYAGTPSDCYSCHEPEFKSVTEPNHVTGNFDHVCTICHSTTAWSPATFDHNLTNFPLTGAHTTAACLDCHENGYTNTPSDCFFCHETEYNNTTDPNHKASQFPVTCQDCHNTNNWEQTTWDHDARYFPIYSGEHRGEWDACSDCHTNSSNYTAFECINCHAHQKSEMDNEHDEVRNYQYLSTACYNCHPNGKED